MSKPNLVHLHLHTDSSFMDGVGRPEEYAALAKKYGMPAIGISDHGNLHGLPSFRNALRAEGIKPLFGCEFYLNADRDLIDRVRTKIEDKPASGWDETQKNNHQLLIAMNPTGWANLLKLNHDCVLKGYYYYPRTTVDLVLEHNEGLICTSTCVTSIFSKLVEHRKFREAEKRILQFREAFGDRFYIELQPWEFEHQRNYNGFLAKMVRKHKIEPVLTCDVHYALPVDKDRQEETFAMRKGQTLEQHRADAGAWNNDSVNYFMSHDEACDLYAKNGHAGGRKMAERACANTLAIADRCDVDIYQDDTLKPPIYRTDDGKPVDDAFATLKELAIEGFKKVVVPHIPKKKRQPYKDRLVKELRIIKRCEMSNFYLVTMDVVKECHRRGIMVWVRGSGCASLVAACLEISRQDPLRYSLLFERFIDPSRPNAPDFDLDIDATRRTEIVDYVTDKYGGKNGENIARIIAIQTYGLKAALNGVARTHAVDSSTAWKLSEAAASLTLDKKVETSLASSTPDERRDLFDDIGERLIAQCTKPVAQWARAHPDLIDAALTLVGRRKGRARHAAGYVITPTPCIDYIPIDRVPGDKSGEHVIVTAWGEGQASSDISPTGLMKLDLLGLDTITVVSQCIALASQRHNRDVWSELDSWKMDYADSKVAAEFATGRGVGLHQLSEVDQGLAKFAKELKPSRVEDVTAMVALYRPGSIEFLEQYKRRAHGLEEADSVHPIYDEIVAETYGIIVYQEQIMHVLNRIGGIELREAYKIIKAISKKKIKDIQAARDAFIKGAESHDMDDRTANEIFDLIEKFAGYGFNKAHAASYAELSWVTAYLRANYPIEFYIALLNSTKNQAKRKKGQEQDRKIEVVMRQASAAGIKILPPAIGLSGGTWRIGKGNALIAPLSIVSGVGETAADHVRAAHRKHKFKTIFELLEWAEGNKGKINAGALKSCAKAGAFRTFRLPPAQAYDLIVAWSGFNPTKKNGTQLEQLKRQLEEDGGEVYRTIIDPEVRMSFEREALGFAFWHNPWNLNDRLNKIVRLSEAGRIHSHTETRLRDKRRPFLITSIRPHTDRKGGKMAFLTLSTIDGDTVKAVAFSRTWKKCRAHVDNVYLIAGTFDNKGDYIVADMKRPLVNLDGVE